MNPVLIFFNGLGDHLLALPAIRALCSIFQGKLSLVCIKGISDILFRDVGASEIIEIDAAACVDGEILADVRNLALQIGSRDLIITLNRKATKPLVQLLSLLRPEQSIGFFKPCNTLIPFEQGKHASDLAFKVPLYFDDSLILNDFAASPSLHPSVIQEAKALRADLNRKILTVHIDSNPAKSVDERWTNAILSKFLQARRDYIALIVGRRAFQTGVRNQSNRIFSCVGLPLNISLALVGISDLFLGVDSCMLHAADLFRIPAVGLFGPTDPAEFGVRVGLGLHLQAPFHEMNLITVDEVVRSLNSMRADT